MWSPEKIGAQSWPADAKKLTIIFVDWWIATLLFNNSFCTWHFFCFQVCFKFFLSIYEALFWLHAGLRWVEYSIPFVCFSHFFITSHFKIFCKEPFLVMIGIAASQEVRRCELVYRAEAVMPRFAAQMNYTHAFEMCMQIFLIPVA